MSVYEILEEMDEMLENAKSYLLAPHKVVVDGDRLRELLDDIRRNLPAEVKEAQNITYERTHLIQEAQQRAEQLVREAEDRAKAIVSEHAIIAEAQRSAREILNKTKQKCDQTKQATEAYVLQSLTVTEERLQDALLQIRKERENWQKQ